MRQIALALGDDHPDVERVEAIQLEDDEDEDNDAPPMRDMSTVAPEPEPEPAPAQETVHFGSDARGFNVRWDNRERDDSLI